MEVLGVGFFKTGTTSLERALLLLRLNPVYGSSKLWQRPKHVKQWMEFYKDPQNTDMSFFEEYQSSAGDIPLYALWKPLCDKYPEAKVILTVRDPEEWATSLHYANNNIWSPTMLEPVWPLLKQLADDPCKYVGLGWGYKGFEWRKRVIEIYKRHKEEVIDTVDPQRLLVFDVKDGFEKLANFLEVPFPTNKPFPYLNTKETNIKKIWKKHDSNPRLA